MNVDDYFKYIELVYPVSKQDLIKKSISDFNLFLEKFKEENDDDEEEEEVIIYKIFCKDLSITDCYVGMTKKSIDERWYHHKKTCDNENYKYHNKHLYQFIRQTKGISNWDIILLEKLKCKKNLEARAKEQYWIDTENATLNKIRAQKT
jgi:hypothetical protein